MLNSVIQVIILILSASAIWFVGRTEKWKRWGYMTGLAAQPFWAYTTYKNEQWGVLLLTIFYTYCWCMGIYNFWIKKEDNAKN